MSDKDPDGRLPIHYSAMENNVGAILDRISAGDDPNHRDRLGFTPLHLAAQEYAVDAATALLDHGAKVDQSNSFGNTPLFVAVFNSRGRGEMISLLRQRGADPLKANKNGQTPVGLARLIGNYDVAVFFADVK